MADWAQVGEIVDYEDAVHVVLQGIGMRVDPRKVLWCNYPVFWHERGELEEKVKRDTKKFQREIKDELYLNRLWYVGVPKFKLIRRAIAHLSCEIDLYYVACDTTSGYPLCWYGNLIPKTDRFEVALALVSPLVDALSQGRVETDNAKVVERASGYVIYDYLGREWKVPDAFLGFVWALREKGKDFEGLLDPVSCLLMDEFTKGLPSPEVPKLSGRDYEDIVSALQNLGSAKVKAEKAARHVTEKYPEAALQDKIKQALDYLSTRPH